MAGQQTTTQSTLAALETIIGNATLLRSALHETQAALGTRRALSSSLDTILSRYPQCIRDKEELQKPKYAESCRSSGLLNALIFARGAVAEAVAHYTYVSTIDYGNELAIAKSQFGVPCKFISALQLKACMTYLQRKKREEKPLYAREVATALYDDIVKAGDILDRSIVCKDVVSHCRKLVYGIRADTVWPQPYLGREADADLLLRMAHNVICPPAGTGVFDSSTHARVSLLRNLIVTFLDNDVKQVTPLISRRQVAFSGVASPANTISSIASTVSVTSSPVADWYFGYQKLSPELEVDSLDVDKGGFGTVHKARWMNRDVAVKVIRGATEDGGVGPSIQRQTKREKRVWEDVYHQYILPFFGVAEWRGQDALISPWISENKAMKHFEHLSENNKRRRREKNATPLTEECISQRLKFITEAACGILYLHQKGIVHGDIRMGNILLSPDSEPLITDFGLSKPIFRSFDIQPSTAFERSGTLRWMAPELLLLKDPSRTKQSDVWAFACTVLELFSGKIPYSECRDAAFYLAINAGQAPDIPQNLKEAIPALWTALEGCWAKRPEDRPPMEVILMSLMMIRTGRNWMINCVTAT